MADRDPAPPGGRPRRPTPVPRPDTTSGEAARTLGDAGKGGTVDHEPTAPLGSPTTPFENASAEAGTPEVPPSLVDHPRYRVIKWLGSGGMGSVYLAEHRLMGRSVALKVINRDLTDHAGAVERFGREVRAAARLHHPNIVTAFDAEHAGPVHFLVMEFVEGIDLARLVKRQGPLPVAVACEGARRVALGLQHAHEHGMVHRDIKPQNLMMTRSGQVKILDFGLALFASEAVSEAEVTVKGAMLGTADYVAPEQADDPHSADIRADIYSLGCTLYFLLAGHPPFPGGTLLQKLKSHSQRSPRGMGEIRTDLPGGLEGVLDRMLAKDPGQRYRTPAEVAEALSPFVRTPATPAKQGASRTVVDRARERPASSPSPSTPEKSGSTGPLRRLQYPLLAALTLLVGMGLIVVAARRTWEDKRELATGLIPPRIEIPVEPEGARPAPEPPPVPSPTPPPVPSPTTPATLPPAGPERQAPVIGPLPPKPTPPRPPDEVLQGKGLRRVGLVYRLEIEAQVESALFALKALQVDMQSGASRLLDLEANHASLSNERSNCNPIPSIRPVNDERNRSQIEAENARERDRAEAARKRISEIDGQLGLLTREHEILAARLQQATIDFQLREQSFQQLREVLMGRYAALNLDPEVKSALDELNKTARPKVVLGPVENYGQYRKKLAGSAAQTLRFKGLVHDKGGRYLLASELMARAQGNALKAAREKLAKAESSSRRSPTAGADLEGRRKKLVDELAGAVIPQRKSQLQAQINVLDGQIERSRKDPTPPTPAAPGPDLRAEVLRAVVDLRKTAEAIRRQRTMLDDDSELKEAIAELNNGRKAADRVHVPADPEAARALDLLEKFQETIGLREVPVRVEDGTSLVEACFNGGPVSGLVVAHGAIGLRLASSTAAGAGVGPTPDAATVPVKLADGRLVPARRATLGSLRLGPIDLADVPCLILPPETGDPIPSLGTGSLGSFAVHLDPERAKLYLARIESAPSDRP